VVLSGVALFYACFGMAASAIHAKITARALPCPPNDIFGFIRDKISYFYAGFSYFEAV
jgi:hypothetical protein